MCPVLLILMVVCVGPVTLSRGIKQDDCISSQLYIMSIEPLLMRLRNEPLFNGLLYHWMAQLN